MERKVATLSVQMGACDRGVRAADREGIRESQMLRNTFRSVLGLLLVAGATWLANYITERVFGPEEIGAQS